jgi:large subunit ribosomal protein L10
MNRQEKSQVLKVLETKFAQSKGSFLVGCQGLTVTQMQSLRGELYGNNATVYVAKNRLVKLAIDNSVNYEQLNQYLQGQLAVVFAESDEVSAVAKTLETFAKKNKELKLVAGCYEKQIFNAESLKELAKLPSRDVLLAQLMGVMQAPTVSFVVVLRQLIVKLLLTLKAVEEKKAV